MKKSAALLACIALALSSCSSNAERDTSRKAVLDYSKNYVHLPLDEYAFDELTLRTVSTACSCPSAMRTTGSPMPCPQ